MSTKGSDFDAEYRFGDDSSKGGYNRYLNIDNGKSSDGQSIYGHSFFGDDKFEVEKVEKAHNGNLMVTLSHGISSESKLMGPFTTQIELQLR